MSDFLQPLSMRTKNCEYEPKRHETSDDESSDCEDRPSLMTLDPEWTLTSWASSPARFGRSACIRHLRSLHPMNDGTSLIGSTIGIEIEFNVSVSQYLESVQLVVERVDYLMRKFTRTSVLEHRSTGNPPSKTKGFAQI
jgi:hypothetical protein